MCTFRTIFGRALRVPHLAHEVHRHALEGIPGEPRDLRNLRKPEIAGGAQVDPVDTQKGAYS